MASSTPDPPPSQSFLDSDLDPAQFLKTVRQLSEKRDREDAERMRKLEEEVAQGRLERAARRAERARSISPQKVDLLQESKYNATTTTFAAILDNSASTPRTIEPSTSTSTARSLMEAPAPASALEDVPEFKGFGSTKSRPEQSTSPRVAQTTTTPSVTQLARSGTLSWQQRPQKGSTASPSPASRAAPPPRTASPTPEPNRDQIAASLGARDPSWFRQTADRGVGSPALRKSKDEVSSGADFTSGRRGLPGMSREMSTEVDTPSSRVTSTSTSTDPSSRYDSARQSSSVDARSSVTSASSTKPDLKSLIAADEDQQRASPSFERETVQAEKSTEFARPLLVSRSQAILTREPQRSPSPTKGMGGFVQSAMLKRSDSQSKRLDMSSSTGLSRTNSLASSRGLQGSYSMPKLEPSIVETATASAPNTRQTSASSYDLGAVANKTEQISAGATRAMPIRHSRPKSVASIYGINDDAGVPQSPGSPSKKWSPTKSSWIESALTRPESPQPITLKNSQPAWMANLAKANAQRASGEVSPTREISNGSDVHIPVDVHSPPTPQASKPADSSGSSARPAVKPKPITDDVFGPSLTASTVNTASTKPKPSPAPKPTTDFRSTLKPRAAVEVKPKEEPEFLSKFGNLRKTQQEKYVAPDVLKDNILRGKSGLAVTGGPVKTERRDELKESLLARKEDIKKAKEEGGKMPGQLHEQKLGNLPQTSAKPEALARRDMLQRSESANAIGSLPPPKPETPEASARHRSIKQQPAGIKQDAVLSKPVDEPATFSPLHKQVSAPAVVDVRETSKLAARFNPGLAGLLARGPPSAATRAEASESESSTPAAATADALSEPQIGDARSSRARRPKRKGATAAKSVPVQQPEVVSDNAASDLIDASANDTPAADVTSQEPIPAVKAKREPPPGSAASLMIASLNQNKSTLEEPASVTSSPLLKKVTSASIEAPAGTAESPSLRSNTDASPEISAVPEFQGFGSAKKSASPFVRRTSPEKSVQGSGLGLELKDDANTAPPKPAKSSRIVSGQIPPAATDEGLPTAAQLATQQRLNQMFGTTPRCQDHLGVDTQAVIRHCHSTEAAQHSASKTQTIQRSLYEVVDEHNVRSSQPHQAPVLFDEHAYVLIQAIRANDGVDRRHIFLWTSERTPELVKQTAQNAVIRVVAGHAGPSIEHITQGQETAEFLDAIGGILMARRGTSSTTSAQYMLCGRDHLGRVIFDEVDFSLTSLCHGFVYLVSTRTATSASKLYIWRGSACSTEELSAARLMAMEISPGDEVTEIQGSHEPASFLQIFRPNAKPIASLPQNSIWSTKAQIPHKFHPRLFHIQTAQPRPSLLSSLFRRRPSTTTSTSTLPYTSRPTPSRSSSTNQAYEALLLPNLARTSLSAEGIYVLDAITRIYVLVGPLFAAGASTSKENASRDGLFAQALLFAAEYALLVAAGEDRKGVPKGYVVMDLRNDGGGDGNGDGGGDGDGREVEWLLGCGGRGEMGGGGIWGTEGLMAGGHMVDGQFGSGKGLRIGLDEAVEAVCML